MGRTLANLRSQVAKLEDKRLMTEALEVEYNNIVRKKKAWETERIQLKHQISELECDTAAISKLTDQINILKTENRSIQSNYEERMAKITSKLEKDVAKAENAKSVAERLCTEYKNKYLDVRNAFDGNQENVETLKSEINLKERLIKSVEASLAMKKNEVETLKEDVQKMRKREEKYRSKWLDQQKYKTSKIDKENEHVELKRRTRVTTEELTWSERLSEEENKSGKSVSKHEFEMAHESRAPSSLARAPLGTVDLNSMSSLNLFGAKAAPELKLGKLNMADKVDIGDNMFNISNGV